MDPQGRRAFRGRLATTHWSVVLRATEKGEGSGEALAALCETYWYPLYAYARRRGFNIEDAQDLTQAFFVRILERDFLARASPERGRFRGFLLTAFKYFLANAQKQAGASKRGGGIQLVSLEEAESRYQGEPADQLTPEMLYERHWALTLIAVTLAELQREAERRGRRDEFEALRPLLAGDDVPYKTVAAQLDMSVGALKVAVHRLRRRFAHLLRARIADTVDSVTAIDDELRCVLAAVGYPAARIPNTL